MNTTLPEKDTLTQKVKAMREAQRQYFASRSPEVLKKAKRLEEEVDSLIAHQGQIKMPLA
jgi:hypothetical protein